MRVLRQLADPAAYRACDWDLKLDADGRCAWVRVFDAHRSELLQHVRESYPDAPGDHVAAFDRDYAAALQQVAETPERFPRIDILLLDQLRQELLDAYGLSDPYRAVKSRENAAALELLPRVLAEVDAATGDAESELLIRGLLAGNLFDLGAAVTTRRFRDGTHDFWRSRRELPARPWFRDDVDRWRQRWRERPLYQHALLFVDNAGWDIALGCLPLARWMNRHGTRVTLAANRGPALNDITAGELVEMLSSAAALDDELARAMGDGRLEVIATGSGAPLLDLASLANDFVARAAACDLILLHGMGRALESNRATPFSCDVLRTAVVKDALVAGHVGSKLLDCVVQFDQPTID